MSGYLYEAGDSAEMLACKLLMSLADAEGRVISPTSVEQMTAEDIEWIKAKYQECLDVASGLMMPAGA